MLWFAALTDYKVVRKLGEKMIETVFRSEDLPAGERFDAWRAMAHWATAPLEFRSDHEEDFPATLRLLELGAVDMFTASFPSLQILRTPKLIKQSDAEQYKMGFLLRGNARLSQMGRDVTVATRELVLYSTWRPFDIWIDSGRHDMATTVAIRVPRALLPLPSAATDQLIARRISGRTGIGALLVGLVTNMIANTSPYQPSDAPRLGTVLLDLLTALLAHEVDADRFLPSDTRQRTLALRIRSFIQQRLGEAQLTPSSIAAAHHISTSQLHRIFQQQDLTVSAWIRSERLERCRHDLTDPALHATPIHVIAARWGFSYPADFSRAFRAAYGISPRDYRHTALHNTIDETHR
ncbi:helix-turn-helix domain-containing protein [Frankia sp. CiP3]|uniref:AraC-like ligand-binding domain-containing protein n=1 Tax=Frankia sp. CiP3 TaxID=2880971 RepID=UPI001EF4D3C5|nr:helix-turn-helix domain-containing protein [Frankia sp. CiP3]